MAQQTAVEWFHKKTWELKMLLEKQQISVGEYGVAYYDILEESKEMEREQHDVTFTAGYDYRSSKEKDIIEAFGMNSKPTFEQYYTQTYGTRLQNETNRK